MFSSDAASKLRKSRYEEIFLLEDVNFGKNLTYELVDTENPTNEQRDKSHISDKSANYNITGVNQLTINANSDQNSDVTWEPSEDALETLQEISDDVYGDITPKETTSQTTLKLSVTTESPADQAIFNDLNVITKTRQPTTNGPQEIPFKSPTDRSNPSKDLVNDITTAEFHITEENTETSKSYLDATENTSPNPDTPSKIKSPRTPRVQTFHDPDAFFTSLNSDGDINEKRDAKSKDVHVFHDPLSFFAAVNSEREGEAGRKVDNVTEEVNENVEEPLDDVDNGHDAQQGDLEGVEEVNVGDDNVNDTHVPGDLQIVQELDISDDIAEHDADVDQAIDIAEHDANDHQGIDVNIANDTNSTASKTYHDVDQFFNDLNGGFQLERVAINGTETQENETETESNYKIDSVAQWNDKNDTESIDDIESAAIDTGINDLEHNFDSIESDVQQELSFKDTIEDHDTKNGTYKIDALQQFISFSKSLIQWFQNKNSSTEENDIFLNSTGENAFTDNVDQDYKNKSANTQDNIESINDDKTDITKEVGNWTDEIIDVSNDAVSDFNVTRNATEILSSQDDASDVNNSVDDVENVTLYRFVFPGDLPSNPNDRIDLTEEEVLVDNQGIPGQCNDHINRVTNHYLAFVNELLEEKEKLVKEKNDTQERIVCPKANVRIVFDLFKGKNLCLHNLVLVKTHVNAVKQHLRIFHKIPVHRWRCKFFFEVCK